MNQTSLTKYAYGDMSFFSFPPQVQTLLLQKTYLPSDQSALIKKCMTHNWWIHAKEMFPTLRSRGYRDPYISPEVMDNLDVAAQVMDPTGKFQDDILNILKADTIAMMKRKAEMTVFYEDEIPIEDLKSVEPEPKSTSMYQPYTSSVSTSSFPLYPSTSSICMSVPQQKEKDHNGYFYSVAQPAKQSVKNINVSEAIQKFLDNNINQQSKTFGTTLECYFSGSKTYTSFTDIKLPKDCFLLVRFVASFGRKAIVYQIKANYATVIHTDDDATPGNVYMNDSSIRIGNVLIADLKRFNIHGAPGNWIDVSVFNPK
jgi:hypothetical protein